MKFVCFWDSFSVMMSGSSSRVLSAGKGFEVVEDLDLMEEGR